METIEIIVEETVQPIILELYQEITPPIVLESYEGKSGDSAYVEAVNNGFIGTEQEWLESLKGEKGDVGDKGDKGDTGEKGDKGDKGDSGANAVWGDITGSLNDQVDLQNALNLKVDKIDGKGLSENDYTALDKEKLSGIQEGAEVNVNPDWNATGGDAEILNKPTIPSISGLATVSYVDSQDALKIDKVTGKSLISDSEITRLSTVTNFDNSGNVTALANKVDKITGKQLSTEDYTTAEKTKLSGIATGATANDTDANLKNRANHTGSQLASTISDFATAVGLLITNKVDKITGYSLTKNDLTDILKTAYDNAVSSLATLLATGSRLITSGEITKLSNTSGTNSGDNATNSQYSGLASSKEDTANKTNLTSDSGSTTKFPVFATILSYFDSSRLKTILGVSTLSGSNTGDETSATILTKLGYTPIKSVIKDTAVSSTITGVTTETLCVTYPIPAGTFSANDIAKLTSFLAEKTGTAGTVTMRVKVGTTNVFSSATTIATYTTGVTELWCIMQRWGITLRGGNMRVLQSTISRQSDIIATSGIITSFAFNPAIDNYLFTSLQLSVGTDSVFQSNLTVTN